MTGLAVFALLAAACWVLLASTPTGLATPTELKGTTGLRGTTGLTGRAPKTTALSGTAASGTAVSDTALTDTALMIDLLGAMLSAGAPVGHALGVLADSCSPDLARSLREVRGAIALGAGWDAAWTAAAGRAGPGTAAVLAELSGSLKFAELSGASSAAIVHAHASQLRRRRNAASDQRAATLGVRLVVPLGLCYLPAFICLGVLPVVLSLLPQWG